MAVPQSPAGLLKRIVLGHREEGQCAIVLRDDNAFLKGPLIGSGRPVLLISCFVFGSQFRAVLVIAKSYDRSILLRVVE